MTGNTMRAYEERALEILDSVDSETGFLWTGGTEAQVISHMLLEQLGEDVPHLTVDTGNQFESVYEFREEYHDEHLFEWHTRQNRDLLKIIRNEDDPRGYHGQLDEELADDTHERSEWDITESCGRLKTQPMEDFIVEDGYETLITGVKRDDRVAADDLEPLTNERTPVPHDRINPLYDWTESHVWAYLKYHFVDYPTIYDEGYRHTDSKCCTGDDAISEHGGEGFDDALDGRKKDLQDMGYV